MANSTESTSGSFGILGGPAGDFRDTVESRGAKTNATLKPIPPMLQPLKLNSYNLFQIFSWSALLFQYLYFFDLLGFEKYE
jgi:hypothetical protein